MKDQRARFEAAWRKDFGGGGIDESVELAVTEGGHYVSTTTQCEFRAFQNGEASGLERLPVDALMNAAELLELAAMKERAEAGTSKNSEAQKMACEQAAKHLFKYAEQIRALLARGDE